MKIAILGYEAEGRSSYEYWKSDENQITICDQDAQKQTPPGVETQLGAQYLTGLDRFDLLVRTASLNPRDIVAANSPSILDKVTSSTNEFLKVAPSKNVIGVTGTKGKGTTSTLIAELLTASGHRVHLGGNVGTPAIDLLKTGIDSEDWIVLELSSFQLVDLKYPPLIGVCLMIAPEHLNWHLDFKDYVYAKRNLFLNQSPSGTAIYFADNEFSKALAEASPGKKIAYFDEPGAYVKDGSFFIAGNSICRTDEVQLLGEHNWQNICAALTAYWQVDHNSDVARQVLTTFKGLENRLELIREKDGVKYYNDSFASVPDAAIAAMDAVTGNKIMIIGGFDRQLELNNLAASVKAHEGDIKRVVLIGASAKRTAEEFRKVGFLNFQISQERTMDGIVSQVNELVQPNQSVVLSPGFPSFDMFKNFEERGQKFKEAVNSL